ncbi:barstar family protein [Nonomuraea monospora]|uniref:Barstar family protein n=1 Tax=Nonomuraea monospora TaxID=568818 RepID=A0ABP5PV05_9ACTN
MDSREPKFLLIDGDGRVLGACLDADGLFVEPVDSDEPVTVEILGCLATRRLRDYLEGSKRYRLRNPLWLEGLRMLDAAGEPLVDFWVSEIIEWRPSRLGAERVDIVADWGYDSPRAGARHIWERWWRGRPDRVNQWAVYGAEGRREWLSIVGRALGKESRRVDRLPGHVYHLDGRHITDECSFYLAMGEAINGPGGYFGWNLDALNDCLRGGAGKPFTLIWSDAHVARRSLTGVIWTILEEHRVEVVSR